MVAPLRLDSDTVVSEHFRQVSRKNRMDGFAALCAHVCRMVDDCFGGGLSTLKRNAGALRRPVLSLFRRRKPAITVYLLDYVSRFEESGRNTPRAIIDAGDLAVSAFRLDVLA